MGQYAMPEDKLLMKGIALPAGGFIASCKAGEVRGEKSVWCKVIFDCTFYPQAPTLSVLVLPDGKLKGATLKRKVEFHAGRYAAYHALARAGTTSRHVGGAGGSMPEWPAGWCGSITHALGRVLAVVASADTVSSLGVDCEKYAPAVAAEIESVIINAAEKACLRQSDIGYLLGVLIAFSAKESLYKALWPEVRQFFNFQAAELCFLDGKRQHFVLQLQETLIPTWGKGRMIIGRFSFDGEFITMLVCLPRTTSW
ncbi:hypothetical protein DUU53_25655 [Salmonella enterica subsp. enterica serovar Berlin]|nr:hypothetical protein [Salmonella enterica subsp. enterica serovar Berlin]